LHPGRTTSAEGGPSEGSDGLPDVFWPTIFFGSLFLAVLALTCLYELEPSSAGHRAAPFMWTDGERDVLMLGSLAAVTLGLAVRWLGGLPRSQAATRTAMVALGGLTWLAGISYFYGAHGARLSYSHLHDSYHYVMGAKYFPELGYDQLYVCTAQATEERLLSDSAQARDLSNDRTVQVRDLRAGPSCQDRFSAERWAEFRQDVQLFVDTDPGRVRRVLRDRGYNGTPLQAFLAGSIARTVPLEYATLSLFTLFDVFSLCAMLAVLCQAFGWRLGLLCALLFFTQFVDRFLIIGGSFFRYQWLAALGFGIAWLKLGRYGRAGAALAVASALNVFPVLFAGGLVAKAVLELARTRRLSVVHRRFFGGALAASALCLVLGAAHGGGLDNYARFAEAMRVHDAAGRVPGFGVGFKYNFVPVNWTSGPGDGPRERALRQWRPAIVAGSALLLLLTVVLLPRLDDVEGAVLCGFAGLFCIFGPTGYYFAFAATLVLCWHRRAFDSGGFMLLMLFVASLPPLLIIVLGANRYFVFNRVVSACWTAYLAGMLGYLGVREKLHSFQAYQPATPSE
jgi:hypothetical protein